MRSRRSVLALGAQALSVAPFAGSLVGQAASAATSRPSGEGRSVVCVWLNGGEDSNNLIIPTDGRYEEYARARRSLALDAGRLCPLQETHGSAGLHQALAPLGQLFDAGDLSIALSVGDSSRQPERDTHDYSALEFLSDGAFIPRWAASISRESVERRKAAVSLNHGVVGISRSAIPAPEGMNGPANPQTRLGQRLAEAARAILSRGQTSGPMVLQVVHDGYDTHRDSLMRQHALYAELGEGIAWFWSAITANGLKDRVMLYTDSEFGREMEPNGKVGSEHGWAAHRILLGGPLAGGRIHGSFPSFVAGSADDASGRGSWRPKMERSALERQIALWAGVEG